MAVAVLTHGAPRANCHGRGRGPAGWGGGGREATPCRPGAHRRIAFGQMRLIAAAPAQIALGDNPDLRPTLQDKSGDAQMSGVVRIEPDCASGWDGAAQPAPDFDVDRQVNG